MPKYLAKAKYTAPEGVKGLLADGGSVRVKAVTDLIESVGGKLESFYFAFGETDAYIVLEVPDATTGAALSLIVGASGLATVEVVQLLTPAELDEAVKKSPRYDAPGPNA
ncbi:MAG: GYD domain-containing protein [Dehalococcoidia bacterium]